MSSRCLPIPHDSKPEQKALERNRQTTWPAVHSLEPAAEIRRAHLHEIPTAYKSSVSTAIRPMCDITTQHPSLAQM